MTLESQVTMWHTLSRLLRHFFLLFAHVGHFSSHNFWLLRYTIVLFIDSDVPNFCPLIGNWVVTQLYRSCPVLQLSTSFFSLRICSSSVSMGSSERAAWMTSCAIINSSGGSSIENLWEKLRQMMFTPWLRCVGCDMNCVCCDIRMRIWSLPKRLV